MKTTGLQSIFDFFRKAALSEIKSWERRGQPCDAGHATQQTSGTLRVRPRATAAKRSSSFSRWAALPSVCKKHNICETQQKGAD